MWTEGPTLPSVLALKPEMLRYLSENQLDDLFDYHDADILHLAGSSSDYDEPASLYSKAKTVFDGSCTFPGLSDGWQLVGDSDVAIVATPISDLSSIRKMSLIDPDIGYILTNGISVRTETASFTAQLDPHDELQRHDAESDTEWIYLTGQLPADYWRQWGTITVRGIAPVKQAGAPLVSSVTCHSDGRLASKGIPSSRLGLRALDGVGKETAKHLRGAGLETREDVAEVTRGALKGIQGIGKKKTPRIYTHSRALESGQAIRTGTDPVPGDEPIILDIAVDGIRPDVIWQIGVLDTTTDDYRSYIARKPDEAVRMTRSFGNWLRTADGGRTIVAWCGETSVLGHLEGFLKQHAPEYVSDWHDYDCLDLHRWTVEDGNVQLPCRVSRFRPVARAVGASFNRPEITRVHAQSAYRQWKRALQSADSPSGPVAEHSPDWRVHREAVEDRVRAVEQIFQTTEQAARVAEAVQQ